MSTSGFNVAACQHCGEHIEFPEEGAGVTIACPHCELETVLEILTVVEAVPEMFGEPAEINAGELKAALAGTVPRRGTSIFYQLGLLLVTLFMVLLPIVYVAFVVGVGYATYWYGVHARGLISGATGGLYFLLLRVLLYLGPIAGGVVSVFFMFKPILARPRRHAEALELNPAEHARLYQFIAHLCDMLQVPMPRRICLDGNLNASVSFRRGWLSFLGNDMVLTLGLPLVAGLNTRQLAAVVAHELGHGTQTFARRLGYVINRINDWFVRVVYVRDAWDEAFEDWANSMSDSRLRLVSICVGVAIWLSRKILAALLYIGVAASCYLSRQKEYHADECAVAVAGSAGLESMLVRLREQVVLLEIAFGSLKGIWHRKRRLPDSLPDYLTELELRVPPTFREEARRTLLNETAGWLATHPTAAQRIQRARQLAQPGLFDMEKPARWLFKDFAKTARAVSAHYYRDDLRLPVTDPMLRPVAEFFQEAGASEPRKIKLGRQSSSGA